MNKILGTITLVRYNYNTRNMIKLNKNKIDNIEIKMNIMYNDILYTTNEVYEIKNEMEKSENNRKIINRTIKKNEY